MKKFGLGLLTAGLLLGFTACSQSVNTAGISEVDAAGNTEILAMTVGTWKTAQTIQPFAYEKFQGNDAITVKPFTNPGDMKTALLAGDLDLTGTTWVTAVMAASKGEPIRIVASMTEKCSALVVAADSDIQDVKDLKGKTVAYVPGTMHHILLLESLEKAGLDPDKDVTMLHIDFFDMGQALATGSVDAFLSGEPYPAMAAEDGYGRILSYPYFDDSIGFINAAMITRSEVIEREPEKVARLVDMHVSSTKYLKENREEWIQMAAAFGTEEKFIRASAENIELTWDISEATIQQVQRLAEKMHALGMIDKVPNIEEFLDLRFLKEREE